MDCNSSFSPAGSVPAWYPLLLQLVDQHTMAGSTLLVCSDA